MGDIFSDGDKWERRERRARQKVQEAERLRKEQPKPSLVQRVAVLSDLTERDPDHVSPDLWDRVKVPRGDVPGLLNLISNLIDCAALAKKP